MSLPPPSPSSFDLSVWPPHCLSTCILFNTSHLFLLTPSNRRRRRRHITMFNVHMSPLVSTALVTRTVSYHIALYHNCRLSLWFRSDANVSSVFCRVETSTSALPVNITTCLFSTSVGLSLGCSHNLKRRLAHALLVIASLSMFVLDFSYLLYITSLARYPRLCKCTDANCCMIFAVSCTVSSANDTIKHQIQRPRCFCFRVGHSVIDTRSGITQA